jgi:biopolymer transport protein ExbD
MRRYSSRTSLTTLSEINITPLLDLAFVLLIIFMITTPLLENSKTLIIPSSATTNAPINPSAVQILSMDRNEVVRLNEEVVDLPTLAGRLTALKQADPNVVKEAERLADIIKKRNLPTVDIMWQELIKLAEEPQKELFKIL